MFYKLRMAVDSAEKILIGIGNEWKYDTEASVGKCGFGNVFDAIVGNPDRKWMLPFLEYICMQDFPDDKLKKAYSYLKEFIGKKDCYLISSNCDRYALQGGFDENRCVYPFGSFDFVQSLSGRSGLIRTSDCTEVNFVFRQLRECRDDISILEKIKRPFIDNDEILFNQKDDSTPDFRYLEELYSKNWNSYLKWLSGTLNHDTLILELGVNLEYPSVIRWPFEKVAMINNKAYMMRVNEKLYQLTENIKDKAVSVRSNSVEYICQEYEHER